MLVLLYHPRLDFTTAPDNVYQSSRCSCQNVSDIGFNPGQKVHIGNRPILDDFGQTCTELALWQSFERIQITYHFKGLVKSANHVFTQRVINGSFAAY